MLDLRILHDLRITAPADVRRAAILLRDTVDGLCGLRTAVSHNISVKDPMRDADGEILASTVFGFREGADRWWLNSQLALSSPLIAACRFEAEPFWCSEGGIRTRRHNPLLDNLDFSNFADRAMTRAAIVVPIHLPFGQVAAASFSPRDGGADDLSQEFDRCSDILGVYTRQFVVSYVETMRPKPSNVPEPRLSKREVECLRWAAFGKTNSEIALILHLSRATICYHITHASEKMKAVNRNQTVFKAAQLGYLGTME